MTQRKREEDRVNGRNVTKVERNGEGEKTRTDGKRTWKKKR